MGMRILVLGAVWPEPNSSAAGSRMLELLRPFRERGDAITYGATGAQTEAGADLSALGIERVPVRVNDVGFDDRLRQLAPDLVLFDRFFVEEQFGWRVEAVCPEAIRVLDGEDLHALREARQAAFQRGEAMTPADLMGETARREVASILRSDLTLVISRREMALLTEDYGVDPELLHYCPFMRSPPSERDRAVLPGFKARTGFVSIGNFRHAPNADAALWLKQDIWPRIRQALPGARVQIAGAYASPVHRGWDDPRAGFDVVGQVESAGAFLEQGRVCLAPLRFGAGLKGKLVDAMQSGTPSVTTAIGAEGIAPPQAWPGAVEEQADAFAAAAVRLYSEAAAWSAAQARGFPLLETVFPRRVHEPALVAAIEQARASLPARRMRNFVGAMLRDQRHRSTRYLSRWIEAKNRLRAREEAPPDGETGPI